MVTRAGRVMPKAYREHLLVRRIDDEFVVYDMARETAHVLSPSAALVFDHCDGEMTFAEAVDRVAASVSERAQDVVELGLAELQRAALIPAPADAVGSTRITRRRLLQAGIAASILPTIITIAAPAVAQQAVCPTTCLTSADCQTSACVLAAKTACCVPFGGLTRTCKAAEPSDTCF